MLAEEGEPRAVDSGVRPARLRRALASGDLRGSRAENVDDVDVYG
jgi:hypothetical protein